MLVSSIHDNIQINTLLDNKKKVLQFIFMTKSLIYTYDYANVEVDF